MIKKQIVEPIYILQLQALLRRLLLGDVDRREIEEELTKMLAGHRGEKSLEYHLKYLPEKEFFIFHGLRLPGVGGYFQIDLLIVSLRFIVVVEVKNMAGELYFDQAFNQLVQLKDGVQKVYSDPISQAKRQKQELYVWLKKAKFPPIPIETLVVFTNPQTYIKASPGYTTVFEKVIRSIKLPEKIKQFEKMYQRDIYTDRERQKLSHLLLKSDVPYQPDILAKFNIPRSAIKKGVHCPKCFKLPMNRERYKWTCSSCSFTSTNAHIYTLNDYYLLFGPKITNRELRDFLQIRSKNLATSILTSCQFQHFGANKNKRYHLALLNEEGRIK